MQKGGGSGSSGGGGGGGGGVQPTKAAAAAGGGGGGGGGGDPRCDPLKPRSYALWVACGYGFAHSLAHSFFNGDGYAPWFRPEQVHKTCTIT